MTNLPDELIMARAKMGAYPDHSRWEGPNYADCPICHAQKQILSLGLAEIRRIAPGNALSVPIPFPSAHKARQQ